MTKADHTLVLETRAAKLLRASLATITDDSETLRDTIEGETNVREAIHKVLAAIGEDEIIISGIEAAIATLQARKERHAFRVEQRRKAILLAMEAAEITKINYPEATISTREQAAKLIVSDESRIPTKFYEPQEPKLNKALLKAALLSDPELTIEGVTLSNGGLGLTIRKA